MSTCFIAMPISTVDPSIYNGDADHFKHVLDHLFALAVEAAALTPLSPIAQGTEIIHAEIIAQLESADLVLCDVSSEFKRPDRSPDLEVEISLLHVEAGGRRLPLWQGCRLPHDFGLPEEFNDGMYEFLDRPPAPGETRRALIWLLAPERNAGRLHEAFQFRAWEGKFIVQCRIVRVVTPLLEMER